MNKVKLTTTLNRLKDAHACTARYEHLLRCLGGPSVDHDAPINLLTIMEHNGAEDCLWALCATEQDCETVARFIAADCAELALPIYEREYPGDTRPRQAIEAARAFARGEIDAAASDAASASASAAWAAASASASAAWAAASAAWAAASASARAARAAWDAASAAWAAWDAASAETEQIIRKYLEA